MRGGSVSSHTCMLNRWSRTHGCKGEHVLYTKKILKVKAEWLAEKTGKDGMKDDQRCITSLAL
jgi:hypothetical protein